MVSMVREGQPFPAWCELEAFAIHDIAPGQPRPVAIDRPRARLLVTAGSCQVRQGSSSQVLREGQFIALHAGEASLLAHSAAQAVVLQGRWDDELGGCGVFRAENVASPSDRGDPVAYPKHTNIDAHFHDCQEFWLLLDGEATVVVGAGHAPMRPGDCLPIPMGAMHDMPDAPQPAKAVYFETTLRGRKRTGHLWQHTHGPAQQEEET